MQRARTRLPRARTPLAVLEVQVRPKRAITGYLWSYIWSIDLTRADRSVALGLLHGELPAAKKRAWVLRVVARAARRGLPFGPGSLADYDLIEDDVSVRFPLECEAPAGQRASR